MKNILFKFLSLLTILALNYNTVTAQILSVEDNNDDTESLSCNQDIGLINGGFEYPVVKNSDMWELYDTNSPDLGWSVEWVDQEAKDSGIIPKIELQVSRGNWDSYEGRQFAELDSGYERPPSGDVPTSTYIYQSINTIPGATYNVSYAFSARPKSPDSNNLLKFLINGNVENSHGPVDTSANATEWNKYQYEFIADSTLTVIGFEDGGDSNGSGTLIDDVSIECISDPEPQTSNVSICKIDESQNFLAGWDLVLKGDLIEDVLVYPDGQFYSSVETYYSGDYVLEAEGTYVYRRYLGENLVADPAFSLRAPVDVFPGFDYNIFPWRMSTANNLGIRVNGSPLSIWGDFSPEHKYYYGVQAGDGETFDFVITDDNYSDNSGNLSVKIYKGYIGTTDDEGCVTFEDVPFGQYTISEKLKYGWENVSGQDEVDIHEENHTFYVTNRFIEEENNTDCLDLDDCQIIDEDLDSPENQNTGEENMASEINGSSRSSGVISLQSNGDVLGVTDGEVLGACVPFSMYHKKGDKGGEVEKIQQFLNDHINAGLEIDGIYGSFTVKAVHDFQQKYFEQIISPWIPPFLPRTTGRWYKTTRMMANELITCPEEAVFLEEPNKLYKVDWEKSQVN